ncbi:MAG: hypothetical protein AB7K24_32060, partial [Gemmataceae bacterium]
MPRSALGWMLLIPLLGGITLAGKTPAQEVAPPPTPEISPSILQVSVGEARPLQLATLARLMIWVLSRGGIIFVQADA